MQGSQVALVEIKPCDWLTKFVWDGLAVILSVFLGGTGKAAEEPK